MSWDGVERRKNMRELGFCSTHIEFVSDVAVIKASLANIEKTITEGVGFRRGVIIALVGIMLTIILQLMTFSYLFGQVNKQVSVNTDRLVIIEAKINK